MQTLQTLVRNECANIKDGQCLFARECPVLHGKPCSVSKAVLLGGNPNDGQTDYFSACVAPLIRSRPEYAAATAEYARVYGLKRPVPRRCGCGSIILRGKQNCIQCGQKRRLEAKRKWWASTRSKLAISAL